MKKSSETFDKLIIELQKDKKSVASISIKAQDLDFLESAHGQSRSAIIEDMIQTMEEGIKEKSKNNIAE